MNKALFLDRDGTLIVEQGYLAADAPVVLLPGVCRTLRQAQRDGFLLVVLTNQSAINRGWLTHAQYLAHAASLAQQLAAAGVHLTDQYYCPHTPEDVCFCRKPKPGLVWRAAHEYAIDVYSSWMIGDKDSDMLLAKQVPGLRTHRTTQNQPWHLPYPVAAIPP